MKRYMLFAMVALVGTIMTAGCTSYSNPSPRSASPVASTAAENIVTLKNHAYNPSTLTIKKGARVTWRNDEVDVIHTVTSDTGVFDSGNLTPGSTFTYQFNSSGTFPYHCALEPAPVAGLSGSEHVIFMRGTINVQ